MDNPFLSHIWKEEHAVQAMKDSIARGQPSLKELSNYKEEILPLIEDLLKDIKTLRTKQILRNIVNELINIGLHIEIIECHLLQEKEDSVYQIELQLKNYSLFSTEGEKYMIDHFKQIYIAELSFSRQVLSSFLTRLLIIKVVLK